MELLIYCIQVPPIVERMQIAKDVVHSSSSLSSSHIRRGRLGNFARLDVLREEGTAEASSRWLDSVSKLDEKNYLREAHTSNVFRAVGLWWMLV
jgi:hypothetical protein